MKEIILKTKNLTKVFNNQISVDNLSITVERGDIYGFLGENGAGKTTTLKMILGLIPPTSGEITLFNKNIKKNDYSYFKKIGSIIEYPSFYESLTAYENLKLHEEYLGISNRKLIDESLDKLGILNDKNKKVCEFSLGMKQRLGIARAILHKPEILILDEPINGLDPMGIKEIREFIKNIASVDNTTVIISSHILSEIQLLATKIGIIHKGKLLEEISIRTVKDCYKELRFRRRK
ncbi:ABC transporter ATP-binding protein [Clostridium botulinum]|uniref:ABC transporter ATP-binding protein n=1 Tax=Clostridium botulinum TaxID=1491 RepID=A0A9Q1UZ86_CLOBO|nr:ATP-binding cassette domain-containing protein [Clostridium botulinum]AEB77550.1 efflux ABC transporter, ATP-binding protein [Clostridium botulinum BKT015925]KEH95946.1 efflux ABC transporter [Clostridium botulinum C/D str. Sp77]KLU74543.1 ABC transporter ATP-binding protein [Clostridium botulinum V891]KOA76430.1 ABC transporter ATP-binding protein [Clostridium botulinum]KOA78094.1 ABC transporter ATP-binding protein [Clostridium botulinum]